MALSAIMLMVLRSLARSDVAGVREWSAANVLAIAALVLFAARGRVADVLSYDVANVLFLSAPIAMYAGFARHLGRRPALGAFAGLLVVSTVLLAAFHYGVDMPAMRIALSSLGHGVVCGALAWSLRPHGHRRGARYPARFAFWAASILAVVHAGRAAVYGAHYDAQVTLFDTSVVNLICFALGTLAQPGLTLGAVMMANARLIGQARHDAEHDYLTGALSRRAFFGHAERTHATAQGAGNALALMIFDVDHFKAINDTHGHAVGDQVLVDLVARARGVLRVAGCARLGGEEFAVLLPGMETDAAVSLADELRRAFERASVRVGAGPAVGYTVSVGVAGLEPGESLSGLLQRADEALYAAKKGGRNRVEQAYGAGRKTASLDGMKAAMHR